MEQKEEFDKEKAAELEKIEKELEEAQAKLLVHQEKSEADQVTQVEE